MSVELERVISGILDRPVSRRRLFLKTATSVAAVTAGGSMAVIGSSYVQAVNTAEVFYPSPYPNDLVRDMRVELKNAAAQVKGDYLIEDGRVEEIEEILHSPRYQAAVKVTKEVDEIDKKRAELAGTLLSQDTMDTGGFSRMKVAFSLAALSAVTWIGGIILRVTDNYQSAFTASTNNLPYKIVNPQND